jgi:hypothetical protein
MPNGDHQRGVRASALWGSGKRGSGPGSNASALLDGSLAP